MPSESDACDRIFTCRRCGRCCRGYGGTFLAPGEVAAVAGHLDMPAQRFVQKYCQMSGGQPVLAQGADGYCIFWDGLCSIHPVKPHMCRQWPFIRAILVDPANWYIMAANCPGMRTDVPAEAVRQCVTEIVTQGS